jgi:hypothetical protein
VEGINLDKVYNFVLPKVECQLFDKQRISLDTLPTSTDNERLNVTVDQLFSYKKSKLNYTDYDMGKSTSFEFVNTLHIFFFMKNFILNIINRIVYVLEKLQSM